MTTSNLTRAQRKRAKRAKRAQRKYHRLENRTVEATHPLAVERYASRSRRMDRLAFLGWDHLNAAIVASLNGGG